MKKSFDFFQNSDNLLTEKMNPIKESYPDGECPDCSNYIPTDVADGESCLNCGHVFVSKSDDNDDEIDAWMDSLPEPSEESNANYQRNMDYMMKINQEVGVFQDIKVKSDTEEDTVTNNGKYMESSYAWRYGQEVN